MTVLGNAINSPLHVGLVGEGAASLLAANPTSLDFAGQTVGTSSPPQTVRLTNAGNADLVLQAIKVSPTTFGVAGPPLPITLAPAGSVDYAVTFSPSAAQFYLGSASFDTNSPASPTNLPLAGTGITDSIALSVLPSSLSFGSQTVGTTSGEMTVTLANAGASPIALSDLTLNPVSTFAVTGWPGATTLLSAQNLPLAVTFSPQAVGPASGSLSILSDAPGSPHVVALAGEGVLVPTDAVIPTLYNTFLPPLKGQSYNDPAFSGKITRLSDGLVEFATAVHHEYASMSPFNADSTRILLLTGKGGFFIVDKTGKVIVGPDQLGISGLNEPRWSPTDANTLYFHRGNQAKKYDAAAKKETTIRIFFQYSTIGFGGGESDISDDGDHLVIIGDNRFVHVYQISTNTLGPVLDLAGNKYDYFDMSPNNNVLANYGSGGSGRFRGFELFDKNMNFIRQVLPWVGHADRGRDINGDEILVITNNNDTSPLAGCAPGM
ncbi:MAG: choice-of-anchor D domain-containing protein, partial [Candidatus Acidiferrales bacterium]